MEKNESKIELKSNRPLDRTKCEKMEKMRKNEKK